jgi:hypothetical protein
MAPSEALNGMMLFGLSEESVQRASRRTLAGAPFDKQREAFEAVI